MNEIECIEHSRLAEECAKLDLFGRALLADKEIIGSLYIWSDYGEAKYDGYIIYFGNSCTRTFVITVC